MSENKIFFSRHLAVFSSIVVIFLLGVFLGQLIAKNNIEAFTKTQEQIKLMLLKIDLNSQLSVDYVCNVSLSDLNEPRTELSKQLDILEKELKKDDQNLLNMKQEYSILSIKHWLFMKKISDECNRNMTLILFFYSNKENVNQDSKNQGVVLDYFYDKNKEKHEIYIYALDYDLDNSAIMTLKNVFKIQSTPTLVINDVKMTGFQWADNLDNIV